VHGGFAATLLDSCMGLAIWSTLEKGIAQTTLEFKISLIRPITPATGLIKAEGIVLNRGRRIGIADGRITDQNGRLLAHGTTTCLILTLMRHRQPRRNWRCPRIQIRLNSIIEPAALVATDILKVM